MLTLTSMLKKEPVDNKESLFGKKEDFKKSLLIQTKEQMSHHQNPFYKNQKSEIKSCLLNG